MKLWLIEKAISLKEDVFTKHFNEKEDVIIFFSYCAHKQFKLKNTVHLFANDFLDEKDINSNVRYTTYVLRGAVDNKVVPFPK